VQKQQGGADLEDELTGLGIDQTFLRTPATAGQQTLVTDALGTVQQTMTAGGSAKSVYAYDPYGVTTNPGGSSTNTFQYAGRENDGTGLYYNRARYYNPAWGRFISEDPMRFAAGVNFYQYAGSNPTNHTDPSGEGWVTVAAATLLLQNLGYQANEMYNNMQPLPTYSSQDPAANPQPTEGNSEPGDGDNSFEPAGPDPDKPEKTPPQAPTKPSPAPAPTAPVSPASSGGGTSNNGGNGPTAAQVALAAALAFAAAAAQTVVQTLESLPPVPVAP
jgi:RHS repeat-associated protein